MRATVRVVTIRPSLCARRLARGCRPEPQTNSAAKSVDLGESCLNSIVAILLAFWDVRSSFSLLYAWACTPMRFSNVIRLHDICAIAAGVVKHMSWGGGFSIQIPA